MTEAALDGGDPKESNDGDPASGSDNKQQMIKRIVGQRDKAREDAALNEEINKDLLEQNKNLARQIEILQKASGGKPDDSGADDQGGDDKGGKSGNQPDIKQIINQALDERDEAANAEKRSEEFKGKVNAHYERAEKLGFSDYEQAEANALQDLGPDLVEAITDMLPNSEKVLYMLGNKEGEAKRLAALFAKDPKAATIETGRISAIAESYKKESAADPEDDLEPGGSSDNQLAVLQKQLDKAYDKAAETGDLSEAKRIRTKIKALKDQG